MIGICGMKTSSQSFQETTNISKCILEKPKPHLYMSVWFVGLLLCNGGTYKNMAPSHYYILHTLSVSFVWGWRGTVIELNLTNGKRIFACACVLWVWW